ncbi:hypothetical protein BDV28DRAFT_7558 [Aspergillus coremiiformis]|uniref:Uncharacterized protein n=1 Tax=Aspergillus coremiiformis TaxID=138285 RepID=A0A5N6ZF34_9EURO|nr:hypothetical protein BDV28DRAFT_7558 [Aspergillus coremiiformis]
MLRIHPVLRLFGSCISNGQCYCARGIVQKSLQGPNCHGSRDIWHSEYCRLNNPCAMSCPSTCIFLRGSRTMPVLCINMLFGHFRLSTSIRLTVIARIIHWRLSGIERSDPRPLKGCLRWSGFSGHSPPEMVSLSKSDLLMSFSSANVSESTCRQEVPRYDQRGNAQH